jgi:lactoylglutathione lyase
MLRKVDCVMIRVDRLAVAAAYYRDVFGLRPNWSDDVSIGLKFAESDTEIVLHNDPNIPSSIEVYYLVRDVIDEVKSYTEKGCELIVAPFDIRIGKCAVIKDPFGARLCILDMTKGCRASNLAGD